MAHAPQVLALLATAAAATPFTLLAIHSGDVNVHLRPIQAAESAFYLGMGPFAAENCEGKNSTVCPIKTTVFDVQDNQLKLFVTQAGGQLAYIGPDGFLAFTSPSNSTIPPGSITQGFAWTPSGSAGGTTPLTTPETLYACPYGEAEGYDNVFKIFASDKSPDKIPGNECVEIGASGAEYTGDLEATYYL